MPPRYFKDETPIDVRCERCGARHKETLARLYSEVQLICTDCGQEHTADRRHFRQIIDETEAMVDSLSGWPISLAAQVRNWWNGLRA